jgi:hypothetical protein
VSTANHNIWTPDGSTQMTPIQTPFTTLAQSVDDALTVTEALIPSKPISSPAERISAFPNPKQGDSVYRMDRGWVERYYTAYNAASNPGGRPFAGWFAPAGTLLNVVQPVWPDAANDSDSTTTPFIIYRLAIPDPGVPYRIQALGGAEAGSTSPGTRWDLYLGSALTGSNTILEEFGSFTGGEDFAYKQITSIPSNGIYTGSKDVVMYIGRVYGNAAGRLGKFNHRIRVAIWAA